MNLDALGAETLKQGIQFLYAQAADVLARWQDRREGKDEEEAAPPAADLQAVLATDLQPVTIDYEALERLEPGIRTLSAALSEYAAGERAVDTSDLGLVKFVDGLRRALEATISQPIVFRGEDRPVADFEVEIDVSEVSGYVAAIVAENLDGIDARVSIKGKKIDGTVLGVVQGVIPPPRRGS